MIDKQEIEKIKQMIPEYLQIECGINPINLNSFNCQCKGHDDRKPSMGLCPDNLTVNCFSCEFKGDIFTLHASRNNLDTKKDFMQIYQELCKILGLQAMTNNHNYNKLIYVSAPEKVIEPLIDYSKDFDNWHTALFNPNNTAGLEYVKNVRLIDESILKKYRIGYNISACGANGGLIIPTSKNSFITGQIVYNPKYPKYVASKGTRQQIGFDNVFDEHPCYVVEGELDQLTIESIGFPCVALGGTAFVKSFITNLNENKEGNKKITALIIALDNDKAGIDATEQLIKELDKYNIKYIIAQGLYGDYKDANDAYKAYRKEYDIEKNTSNKETFITRCMQFFQEAQELSTEQQTMLATFMQEHNSFYCGTISIIVDKMQGRIIENICKTGFKTLDVMLDGGLRTGLYCFGGMPSIGKTSFLLQIADSLALNGEHILFYTVEMTRESLITKSISRLTKSISEEKNIFIGAECSTNDLYSQKRSQDEIKLSNKAIQKYEKYAKNITHIECFSHEWNATKISTTTEMYIRLTDKKPIVMIDYLQILPPITTSKSVKDAVDYTAKVLKQLASNADIPVIIISNMNRLSYGSRETQSKILSSRNKERIVELSIIKNRSGELGKLRFNFLPAYNFFSGNENPYKENEIISTMADFKESGGVEYSADVLLALLDYVPKEQKK